jgi:hypothetical protein
MALYIVTIFLSAFLLFQVQPLIGKFVLPWFGGGPAVWTTCMLFFQVLLLVGYTYAHATTRIRNPRTRGWLHVAVIALSLAALPIIPSAELWKPEGSGMPVLHILLLLTVAVGAPYFVLSTTGPLLQDWFARTRPGYSPYRLYALSNLGSFLALLSYPFVFEPRFTLRTQAFGWTAGYGVFALLCAWIALRFAKQPVSDLRSPVLSNTLDGETDLSIHENSKNFAPSQSPAATTAGRPSRGVMTLWLVLPLLGSTALLATTNQLCLDVVSVPFLWVMPLAIYLLTFILCFENPVFYVRGIPGIILLFAASGLLAAALYKPSGPTLLQQVVAYAVGLYFLCMACHGELARLRPATQHLTLYYLMIAAGGALGGVFVVLVAPNIFSGYWEFHLAVAATCLVTLIAHARDRWSPLFGGKPRWVWEALCAAWIGLAIMLIVDANHDSGWTLERSRNFYGVLKVREGWQAPSGDMRYLSHGTTTHGFQFVDEVWRRQPTSYYARSSGVGVAVEWHPRRYNGDSPDNSLRIGVVGLGTGTIAALAERGDVVRFYEINPEVVRLCDRHFTYLKDTPAKVDIVMGDARISMERELARGEPQRYDVLAVDAFTSDAIPMHLLTKECAAVYFAHLKPDGILAVHISNRHLRLGRVVRALAKEYGREAVFVDAAKDSETGADNSDWVLVTSNKAFLDSDAFCAVQTPWPEDDPPPLLWTDDYGSLFQVLGK